MIATALVMAGTLLLVSSARPRGARHRLEQLRELPPVGAERRLAKVVFVTAGLAVVAFTVGSIAGIALGGVIGGGVLLVRRSGRVRHDRAIRAGVVNLCRAIAAELRAGQPPSEAFAAAAVACPVALALPIRAAVELLRQGDSIEFANALDVAAAQRGHVAFSGLRSVAACWRVAAVSGAALAPAVERVGDALQDEIDVARDVASLLAGPRATVQLLAVLPVVGLLLGTAIGADPVDFLLHSGPGIACLGAATALDIAGVAWAQRIAIRAARLG